MNSSFCHTVFSLTCWIMPLTRKCFWESNTCFVACVRCVIVNQQFASATFVVVTELLFVVVFASVTVVCQFVCWHTCRGWHVFRDVVNKLKWTTFRGSQWDTEVSNPLWWHIGSKIVLLFTIVLTCTTWIKIFCSAAIFVLLFVVGVFAIVVRLSVPLFADVWAHIYGFVLL